MTTNGPQPTKAQVLLNLAMGLHQWNPNPAIPDALERIRRGFTAVIAALRKVEFVPQGDIDAFVRLAEAGAPFEALMPTATLFSTCLSDETFYAALDESCMLKGMQTEPPHHPEFMKAIGRLKELMDEHGKAAMDLPEYDALWLKAWEFAPPLFEEAARQVAEESGLLPPTEIVNDKGEPVFSAEQVAKHLGVPVERIIADIEANPAIFAKNLYTGPVHKVH